MDEDKLKVLQKQLALAMQEMTKNTGASITKTMETLRHVINFAKPMSNNPDKVLTIRDRFSQLILDDYMEYFERDDIKCSKEEAIFRIKMADIFGDISEIINDEQLVPAWMMGYIERREGEPPPTEPPHI